MLDSDSSPIPPTTYYVPRMTHTPTKIIVDHTRPIVPLPDAAQRALFRCEQFDCLMSPTCCEANQCMAKQGLELMEEGLTLSARKISRVVAFGKCPKGDSTRVSKALQAWCLAIGRQVIGHNWRDWKAPNGGGGGGDLCSGQVSIKLPYN